MDTRADPPVDRLEDLEEPASPPLPRQELAGVPDPPTPPLAHEAFPEVSELAATADPPRSEGEALHRAWTGDDALSEFPTESEVPRARSVRVPSHARPRSSPAVVAVAAGVALLVLTAAAAWRWWPTRSAPVADTGTVAVETTPPGAAVVVDGRERGKTPLALQLPVGTHSLTLIGASARRTFSVAVVAGTQVVHHVDLSEAARPKTGRLQISGPAGAPILVDGVRRGSTPAELGDVPAGEHAVTVGEGAAAVTHRVSVPPGGLASLLVPAARPAAAGQAPAWVTIATPIELQVFDDGALIGHSTTSRILVLAGRHTLTLVNTELGYRTARDVTVEPGRVATVRIEPPNGVLHVNATPWAEVLIDGRRLGETPLANLAVPIGAHELTFRNPRFPEQKRSVVISLTGPTRVGVDLRQ